MEPNGWQQDVLGGAQAGGVPYVFCLRCTSPGASSTQHIYELEVADMNSRGWATTFTHQDLAKLLGVQGVVFNEEELQATVRDSLQAHVELHFEGSSLYVTAQGTGENDRVVLRFPPCTPDDTPLAMHQLPVTEGSRVCSGLASTMLAQLHQLRTDLAATRQSEQAAWDRAHHIQATADAAIAALKKQAGLDTDTLPRPSQAHAAATYMASQQQQPHAKRARAGEPTLQLYGTQHMGDGAMARSPSQPPASQRPSGGSAAASPAGKGLGAGQGGPLLRHASSGIERVLGAYNAVRVGSEPLLGSQGVGPSSQGLAPGRSGSGADELGDAHGSEVAPSAIESSSDDDLPPMPENIGRKVVPRGGMHKAVRGRGRGRGGRKATTIG